MLQLLGPLASILGLEAGAIVDKAKRNGVMWATIALFGAVAFIFLLVALHAGLMLWVGPIWAPLIVAALAFIIALGVYIATRIAAAANERRQTERRRSAETTALVTTAAATALPLLLKSPLLRSVGLPLGGALAALYFLTRPGPRVRGGPGDD